MKTEIASPAMDGFFLGEQTRAHPHMLISWPSDPGRWGEMLPAYQHAVAGLVRILSDHASVAVMVDDMHSAEVKLACGPSTAVVPLDGEAPMAGRDGPYVLTDGGTGYCGLLWEGRHSKGAGTVCSALGVRSYEAPLNLDDGIIVYDGHGTVLISEEGALSAARNPELTQQQIEERLALFLGARHVIWLGGGLLDTDGQIAGAVRFIGPAKVAVLETGRDDANSMRLEAIAAELHGTKDADHSPLVIERIPARTGEGQFSPLDCLFADDRILIPPQADAVSLLAMERACEGQAMELALDTELLGLGGLNAVVLPLGFEPKTARFKN